MTYDCQRFNNNTAMMKYSGDSWELQVTVNVLVINMVNKIIKGPQQELYYMVVNDE